MTARESSRGRSTASHTGLRVVRPSEWTRPDDPRCSRSVESHAPARAVPECSTPAPAPDGSLALSRTELEDIYGALQMTLIQVHHGRAERDLGRIERLDRILAKLQQIRYQLGAGHQDTLAVLLGVGCPDHRP